MSRIEKVYQTLIELAGNAGVSAPEIAEQLGLDRANVSSDLNQLWKDGKVFKMEGRPVLFMAKDGQESHSSQTLLDHFVTKNPSVKAPYENGKAAVLYPPDGMHILILGETGVGKSLLAELLYRFAKEVDNISEQAPYITFNCADYAHNPQLLLGQLFGVKKGAFTGAVEQKGLIESANGGFLLLDEIHRLPAEGQEMLFTLIDRGVYRRLGESESERKAKVLIIAATTERSESTLLDTFRRRIPMVLHLPALRERTNEERYHLIVQFFKEESIRLGKEIHVSANTMRSLLFYLCPNNIGQLKTDIQIACAKAYADFISKKKKLVQINSTDLPSYVKEGLLLTKGKEKVFQIPHQYYIFHPSDEETLLNFDKEILESTIYEKIEHKYRELKDRGVSQEELNLLVEMDIDSYFTHYLSRINQRISQTDLTNIILPSVVELCKEIIRLAENRLKRSLSEKVLIGLSLHLQSSLERIKNGRIIINPQLNKIRRKYKQEFDVALESINMIEEKFSVHVPIEEAGFITMFFVLDDLQTDHKEQVSILVIMHGTSVASSMVEVVNRLLDTNIARAIDVPMELEPREVYHNVKRYVETNVTKTGLLLCVDMGSLENFGEMLENELNIPVKVISMSSTPHVLEATRKVMLGYSLDDLYEDINNLNTYSLKQRVGTKANKKHLILTACLTGEGSALAIKQILAAQLTYDQALFEVVPVTIGQQRTLSRILDELQSMGEILCIVSNFPIESMNVPQFTVHDILQLKGVKSIQNLIDYEQTYLKMEETLYYHLKHVKDRELITEIKQCLVDMQQSLNVNISTHDLIGIVLHMSCMVDRLTGGEKVAPYLEKDQYIDGNAPLYEKIKEGLLPLENRFHIHIPDDEICYLMLFFKSNRSDTNTLYTD